MKHRHGPRFRAMLPVIGVIGVMGAIGVTGVAVPSSVRAGAPRAGALSQCVALVKSAPEARKSWGCFYDTARATSEWSPAEAGLRRAMEDTSELRTSRPQVNGYALLTLANLVAVRDAAAGIELYERAVAELEGGEDRLALLFTLLNLAHHYRSGGAPERGAEVLETALDVAEAHGDPKWIATTTVERVRHELRTQGDLGHASQLLARTELLLFPEGDYQAQVAWLLTASSVARRLGKATEALSYSDRLITLATGAEDGYVEATARHNKLGLHLQLEHGEGARAASLATLEAVHETIAVSEAAGNDYAAASSRCMLSLVSLTRGEETVAERAAAACLAAAEVLQDPRIELDARLALARVRLVRGRTPSSEEVGELEDTLARATRLTVDNEDVEQSIVVATLEAELHWRVGSSAEAMAASERALERLDLLRDLQSDPLSRAQFLSRRASVYERHIDSVLGAAVRNESEREALLDAAFATMEHFRARVLRESLDAGADAEQPGSVAPSLSAFSAQLEPGEAVLAYQLAAAELLADPQAGSWVLVITRDQVHAFALPALAELAPALAMFGPALEAGREQGLDAAARSLGRRLITEPLVMLDQPVERLTLLLDDSLHALPFAALRDPESGALLIESFAMSVAPSATLLSRLRQASLAPRGQAVLALADPPLRQDAAVQSGDASMPERSAARTRIESRALAPLPHARREARRITHAAGDVCWIGIEASESRLRSTPLDDYAVLHFATHALIDGVTPQRSAIVLAPGEADGLLEASEVSTLELDGKLVVLSACSSATGQQLTGEGVMGLAHALFEAGAETVVGSLWPLRDDDAFELSVRFYDHLDAGDSVATAMALAQRELADAGRPSSAWASMVVLGNGALVPFPASRTSAVDLDSPEPRRTAVLWIVVLSSLLLGAGVLGVLFSNGRRDKT